MRICSTAHLRAPDNAHCCFPGFTYPPAPGLPGAGPCHCSGERAGLGAAGDLRPPSRFMLIPGVRVCPPALHAAEKHLWEAPCQSQSCSLLLAGPAPPECVGTPQQSTCDLPLAGGRAPSPALAPATALLLRTDVATSPQVSPAARSSAPGHALLAPCPAPSNRRAGTTSPVKPEGSRSSSEVLCPPRFV